MAHSKELEVPQLVRAPAWSIKFWRSCCCLLTTGPLCHRCASSCLQLRAYWRSNCSLALKASTISPLKSTDWACDQTKWFLINWSYWISNTTNTNTTKDSKPKSQISQSQTPGMNYFWINPLVHKSVVRLNSDLWLVLWVLDLVITNYFSIFSVSGRNSHWELALGFNNCISIFRMMQKT